MGNKKYYLLLDKFANLEVIEDYLIPYDDFIVIQYH